MFELSAEKVLTTDLADARKTVAARLAAVALDLELVGLEGRVHGEVDQLAAQLERDMRGRGPTQLERVDQANERFGVARYARADRYSDAYFHAATLAFSGASSSNLSIHDDSDQLLDGMDLTVFDFARRFITPRPVHGPRRARTVHP